MSYVNAGCRSWRLRLLVLAGRGALIALVTIESVMAQCQCTFATQPWKASGTKAACSAVMSEGNTVCNIAFGGTGADPGVVAQVIGQNPKVYEQQVNRTLVAYFQALDSDRDRLTDPKFIETALPLFMRGAYLRQSVKSDLKSLDLAVVEFSKKNSGEISEIFRGKKNGPVNITEQNTVFIITKGVVSVKRPDGVSLVVVFLPLD